MTFSLNPRRTALLLAGCAVALAPSLATAATINGTAGANKIYGTNKADTINARPGNDQVWARGGNDSISGADGNDRLDGGGGADKLGGANGNDTNYGGPGNVAEVSAALADLGRLYDEVRFPEADEEAAALSAAGFAEVDVAAAQFDCLAEPHCAPGREGDHQP